MGIVLKENRQRTSTTLLVSGLAPRGPADVCGLIEIGDVLLKVDGKDVDSTEKASKLILGERGSKIAMVFKRFNADKIEKFTVHMERGDNDAHVHAKRIGAAHRGRGGGQGRCAQALCFIDDGSEPRFPLIISVSYSYITSTVALELP